MFLTTQTKALCLWDCWVATMSFFDSEASCCVTVLNKSAAHTRLLLQVIVQTNWTKETYLEGRVTVWKVVSIVRVYKSHPAVGTVLFPSFFPPFHLRSLSSASEVALCLELFFCCDTQVKNWMHQVCILLCILLIRQHLDAPRFNFPHQDNWMYRLMFIVN